MANQTFTRLYDDHDDAVHIVQSLEQAGVPHANVSLVANNVDARHGADGTGGTGMTSGNPAHGASTGGRTGATLGTVLGGGAGLLAGLGMLAMAWFKKCHYQATPEINRALMVKGFLVLGVTLI